MRTNHDYANSPEKPATSVIIKQKLGEFFGSAWFALLLILTIVVAVNLAIYHYRNEADAARRQREMTEGIPYSKMWYMTPTVIGEDSSGNQILAKYYDRYIIKDGRAYLIPELEPLEGVDSIGFGSEPINNKPIAIPD